MKRTDDYTSHKVLWYLTKFNDPYPTICGSNSTNLWFNNVEYVKTLCRIKLNAKPHQLFIYIFLFSLFTSSSICNFFINIIIIITFVFSLIFFNLYFPYLYFINFVFSLFIYFNNAIFYIHTFQFVFSIFTFFQVVFVLVSSYDYTKLKTKLIIWKA